MALMSRREAGIASFVEVDDDGSNFERAWEVDSPSASWPDRGSWLARARKVL